jgi:hypothetical protein
VETVDATKAQPLQENRVVITRPSCDGAAAAGAGLSLAGFRPLSSPGPGEREASGAGRALGSITLMVACEVA